MTATDAVRVGALARQQLGLLRATSPQVHATLSPLDGSPLAEVPQSSAADVDEAFARARAAQPGWAALGASERGRRLLAFHDLLLGHRADLADLIIVETGKTRGDALEEVFHAAITARWYGVHAPRLLRPERRAGVAPVLTRLEVHHVPKGVVGVLSPWNYPLTMAFSDGVAALAAGNTVVAKPDSQAVLTACAGLDLLRRAGVPEDAWQVVAGPGEVVGAAVVDRADHIAFTGSTRTGRTVAARAGERLIGASLELGGKNPLVVLADADLDAAVAGALGGCFGNAGQRCVSFERVLVARELYEPFRRAFVEATRALDLRVGLDWSCDVGTLTSAAQLEKVSAHVEDARARGATVLAGGRARPDLAPWSYEPTILEGVTPAMRCHREETFGPVVALYPFDSDGDAVAAANDSELGLHASVWSRDHRRGRAVASRIRAGTVNVNEAYQATFGSLAAPMGGFGASGLGRRQGPEGLLRFTETRAVATQRLVALSAGHETRERFAAVVAAGLGLARRLRL